MSVNPLFETFLWGCWKLTNRSKPVIGVIFYSTYGHIAALAEQVIKGAEATGAVVKVYQL